MHVHMYAVMYVCMYMHEKMSTCMDINVYVCMCSTAGREQGGGRGKSHLGC